MEVESQRAGGTVAAALGESQSCWGMEKNDSFCDTVVTVLFGMTSEGQPLLSRKNAKIRFRSKQVALRTQKQPSKGL